MNHKMWGWVCVCVRVYMMGDVWRDVVNGQQETHIAENASPSQGRQKKMNHHHPLESVIDYNFSDNSQIFVTNRSN